jgi:hypothetical protein
MPSTIITKNGSGAPLAADLVAGELAVDLTNGRLYTEDSGGSVIEIGLNPSGNVDVTGTVSADGLTIDSSSGITVNGPTDQDGKLNLVAYAGVQDAEARIQAVRGNTSGTDSRLQFLTNNGTSLLTRVDIDDNGDISFYEDTGVSQSFFWDASAESLGIGTVSPSDLITIQSPASGGGNGITIKRNDNGTDQRVGAISFGNTVDSDLAQITAQTSAGNNGDGNLLFHTQPNGGSSTERLRLSSSGDLSLNSNGSVASLDGVSGMQIGNSTASSAGIALETLNNGYLMYVSGTSLKFWDSTDNTDRITLDGDGNIGQGIAPIPDSSGYSGATLHIHQPSTAASTGASLRLTNATNGTTASTKGFYLSQFSDTNTYLVNREGALVFYAANSEAFRVDTHGDLLLGNSSNTFNSTGRKCLEITGSDNSLFALSDTQPGSLTYRYYIHNDRGNGYINHFCPANNFKMLWWTNGTRRMTLDENGNFLVGTDTVLTGNKHCFVDSSSDTTVAIQENNGAGTLPLAIWNTATTGDNLFVNFYTEGSATERGSIDYNRTGGQVRYNVTSDQRLKENIVDAPSASDDIDAIQVRSFDWIENGYHQSYGLVAQELLTVVPDAVRQPEDPDEMMGVDYSKLVPMMLKEIQSLRARVAQLEGAN